MRITRHDIVKRPNFLNEVVDLVKNHHYNDTLLGLHFGMGEMAFRNLCKDYQFVRDAINSIRLNCDKRVCKKCKSEKEADEFQKDKARKGGYRAECKQCLKEYHQNNYLSNKENIDANNKQWYEKNKETRCIQIEQYRNANRKRFAKIKKERIERDSLFSLKLRLRNRISVAFRANGWSKRNGTQVIIGCNYKSARSYIESKFTDGMSWDNQGKWHIDHIIPLAKAKSEKELIDLCHYTNLQPLWAVDNLIKGAKIVDLDKAVAV